MKMKKQKLNEMPETPCLICKGDSEGGKCPGCGHHHCRLHLKREQKGDRLICQHCHAVNATKKDVTHPSPDMTPSVPDFAEQESTQLLRPRKKKIRVGNANGCADKECKEKDCRKMLCICGQPATYRCKGGDKPCGLAVCERCLRQDDWCPICSDTQWVEIEIRGDIGGTEEASDQMTTTSEDERKPIPENKCRFCNDYIPLSVHDENCPCAKCEVEKVYSHVCVNCVPKAVRSLTSGSHAEQQGLPIELSLIHI